MESTRREGVAGSTFIDTIKNAFVKYESLPFLGRRTVEENGEYGNYKWTTYGSCFQMLKSFANGLRFLQIANPQDMISICAPNW